MVNSVVTETLQENSIWFAQCNTILCVMMFLNVSSSFFELW